MALVKVWPPGRRKDGDPAEIKKIQLHFSCLFASVNEIYPTQIVKFPPKKYSLSNCIIIW